MRSPVVLLLVLLSCHSKLYACGDWSAKVVSFNGRVELGEPGAMAQVALDSLICPGQTLMVGENSRAAIYLRNNSFVRLDQSTVLSFPAQADEESFWLELKNGIAHFISRISKRFVVNAPYVNAAVDGTEFVVSVSQQQNSITVVEGKVTAENRQGRQAVGDGQKLSVASSKSNFELTSITTTDVIDWAIYYSPLPMLAQLQTESRQPELASALNYVMENRTDLALQVYDSITNSGNHVILAKASLLLAAGRSAAAKQLLVGLNTAQSYSLLSIIHSTRNQAESALEFANRAVSADATLVSSWLALSYAQQAHLNLPMALDAAERATTLVAESLGDKADKLVAAIVWARVSELQLAVGNIESAFDAVSKARTYDSDNAYVDTQMGYVQLFRLKTREAEALFSKAIAQDSENPQAHLGLGLTWLREGQLKRGRRQIEYAVSLDPARSVSRSYLGRAYFEEKRDGQAQTQWRLAKQLDPQDPTPYFYEGVRKLFANDPIAAIEELEISKQLNDERALYRSETLLQSDAASRSATLARAYDEVGFGQGVLLSAWDALRNDPTNSEGHRLLADHYLGQSRFDQLRASELLQSQLWQPLSAYPLQPQLSTTGISVVEGAGPQNPSFNEYHSLFTQDGAYGLMNGYGGSDGTWGNDLVGSFLAGPLAVSLGQFHFESDGWRDGAEQEQDIYDAFLQWQVNSQTSLQIQASKLQWDQGDVAPRFSNEVANIDGESIDRDSYRLGLKQAVGMSSYLVASFAKLDSIGATDQLIAYTPDKINFDDIDVLVDSSNKQAELQFVHVNSKSSLLVGGRHSASDVKIKTDVYGELITTDFRLITEESDIKTKEPENQSVYFYYVNQIDETHSLQLAMEYSNIEDTINEEWDRSFVGISNSDGSSLPFYDLQYQPTLAKIENSTWLPKLGLSINPGGNTVVRLAAFRSIGLDESTMPVIQPASFVGFPQLYGDLVGEKSDNYAIAFDKKIKSVGDMGVSYIRRLKTVDLEYTTGDTSSIPPLLTISYLDLSSNENIFNGYWVAYPNPELALSVNLNWDRTHNESVSTFTTNRVSSIDRYSLPLAVELFSRSRSKFSLQQIYYKQRIREIYSGPLREKNDWVTNLLFSYRFPNRLGQFHIGINNLLDVDQEYVNHNAEILAFYPKRFFYASINLNL